MLAFYNIVAAGFAAAARIGHGIEESIFRRFLVITRQLQGEGNTINGKLPVAAHDVVIDLVTVLH